MKQNICIIGLNNQYIAVLSKSISDAFDMFFADVTEFIKFELMDVEHARALCGDDYVKKVERSKVKAVNTFENTLFTMDYSLLNDDDNLKFTQQHSFIIYIKLSKENLERIGSTNSSMIFDVYEFRDKLCEKYADFIIDANGKTNKEILKDIENEFIKLK